MSSVGFRGLMLAPPGAGKGTQGEILAEQLDVIHLATGDLLRQHVADATDIGTAAKAHMDAGELVPDRLVIDMVIDRLTRQQGDEGFILDGFPRTLHQATEAYHFAIATRRTFHAVIMLEVDNDELVRRLVDRGRQSGRSDDNREVIEQRLEVYESNTAPLIDFYRDRGILMRIDGVGTVDEVHQRIAERLGDYYPADNPASTGLSE